MMSRRYVIVVVLSLAGWAAADDAKPDPREKLDTAIPEAIRLLEAKEHLKFIKTFVSPDELKKITEKGSIEDLAKSFGEKKADRLLKILGAIKDAKPTLSDDGKTATFDLKALPDSKGSISFLKVEKYWYIKN